MTEPVPEWIQLHYKNYARVSEWLFMHPVKPGPFLRTGLVDLLLIQGWTTVAYTRPDKSGAYNRARVNNGDMVKFWDGTVIEDAPIDIVSMIVGDYEALAYKIMEMAAALEVEPVIIDLGSGLGGQSIALREAGCTFPIINFELFEHATDVASGIAKGLTLQDVMYVAGDITKSIASPAGREALKNVVRDFGKGRPAIVLSRYAIHTFYKSEEITPIMDFLVYDLSAVAGIHLEFSGDKTPTYNVMCKQIGFDLPVSRKILWEPVDTLQVIAQHPGVTVHERQEVWPHILSDRFPSYLSWTNRA